MANIAVTTADRVHVVRSDEQDTKRATENISAGAPVRLDANGDFTNANGTTTTEANAYGVATKTVLAGFPVTAIRRGEMSGFTLAGAYGSSVFLSDTDGRLADAAGTVSVKVGTVNNGTAEPLGTAHGKTLLINFVN